MVIEQEPFRAYNPDRKKETFTVKLNDDEWRELDDCKKILEQPKDSTAMKQLAWIGAKVLKQDSTLMILETVFKNKRKNRRTGENVKYE